MSMGTQSIFTAALDQQDPAERTAFLDSACGSNTTLRREIDELLQAHEQAGDFLDQPLIEDTVVDRLRAEAAEAVSSNSHRTTRDPLVGVQLGRYKLLERIGEGGMGVVYMAEQREPVRRKVALKILRPGLDSEQVIARFEAERQALAMLDHVGIAKVFDAGTTETHRPYFVMELVHGLPITHYCDESRLCPRERAELFMAVCHAVHHAHQKGIIHRDLKPSNILVASYDGRPVPKIIDFGVAKATNQPLTQRTLFTNFGALIGTLEYMAPEQAHMNALGVDTRSDIYSLGVLLYELLTGTTPLESTRLQQAAFDEVLRLIGEEEPPMPSTRLSSFGEQLQSVSQQRGTEPCRLVKLVSGELDWIAMKCLEKDRARRYETAHGLALDVGRYLNDEAVLASPPSKRYRLTKFVRRHKTWLSAAASVVLALAVGLGAATAGFVQATNDRNRAQDASAAEAEQRRAAEEARAVAEKNEKIAKKEAAKAQAINSVFYGMLQASSARAAERSAAAKDAAVSAKPDEQSLMEQIADVEAVIQFCREMSSGTGLKDPGATLRVRQYLVDLAKSLKENKHPDREIEAYIQDVLGAALNAMGMSDEAEFHLRTALEIRRKIFPQDHLDIANSLSNLCYWNIGKSDFAAAYELAHEALAMRRRLLGAKHRKVADLHLLLSSLAHRLDKLKEAAEQSDAALTILKETSRDVSREMAFALMTHAWNVREQGDLVQSEKLVRQAIAVAERLGSKQEAFLAPAYNTLGLTLQAAQRAPEAMDAFRESVASYRRAGGDDYVAILEPLRTLAKLLRSNAMNEAELAAIDGEIQRLERHHFAQRSTRPPVED